MTVHQGDIHAPLLVSRLTGTGLSVPLELHTCAAELGLVGCCQPVSWPTVNSAEMRFLSLQCLFGDLEHGVLHVLLCCFPVTPVNALLGHASKRSSQWI
jgi:hypothetical protein